MPRGAPAAQTSADAPSTIAPTGRHAQPRARARLFLSCATSAFLRLKDMCFMRLPFCAAPCREVCSRPLPPVARSTSPRDTGCANGGTGQSQLRIESAPRQSGLLGGAGRWGGAPGSAPRGAPRRARRSWAHATRSSVAASRYARVRGTRRAARNERRVTEGQGTSLTFDSARQCLPPLAACGGKGGGICGAHIIVGCHAAPVCGRAPGEARVTRARRKAKAPLKRESQRGNRACAGCSAPGTTNSRV